MIRVEHNVDLTGRNTFGMKVRAAALVEYDEVGDLEKIRANPSFMASTSPILHIGACTNLLFTKDFYPGILFHSNIRFIKILKGAEDVLPPSECGVLTVSEDGFSPSQNGCVSNEGEVLDFGEKKIFPSSLNGFASKECGVVEDMEDGDVEVEVGAGTTFDDFCGWAAERGLWGVENLSGIPGETGAAAVQNIGAYGMEVQTAILRVNCYDMVLGRLKTFSPDDCGYGYRTSLFKTHRKGRYIVTSVTFRLSRKPRPVLDYGHLRSAVEAQLGERTLTPQLIREVVLRTRQSKLPDPHQFGNAGSFFKNPVVPKSAYDKVASIAKFELGVDYKVPCFDVGSGFVKMPAAWLIENCGWKGYAVGNVAVYERQPLVLVNATGEASADEVVALENAIVKSVKDKYDILLTPEVEYV